MTSLGESQIYRDLMRFRPDGLSPNAWAVRAGVSRTVWADMRRHGNPSRKTLEKLLTAAGSSVAEFEALRLGPDVRQPVGDAALFSEAPRGWRSAPLPPLPLVASSLAGEWGAAGSGVEVLEIRPTDLLERLQRPSSLAFDPDAFAFTIVGNNMWPRFRPGRRVAVSPRSPVALGDDVVARLRGSAAERDGRTERVLIAQLEKRTGSSFQLRQFSPDLTFEIENGEVEVILKILGELI